MKSSSLLSTVVVALVCSLAVYFLMPAPAPPEDKDAEILAARVAELEQELEELRKNPQAEPMGQPEAASYESATRTEDVSDLVAREVQRYFAENPVEIAAGGASATGADGELTAEAKEEMLRSNIDELLNTMTSWERSEEIWKQLHEAGLMEEAIAQLEEASKLDPTNVKLMVELADAYLQPIMQGEATGMDAGKWSTKADQTYDAALALDDHNWEARFSKAVSLSFWPPVFGKQPEAIKQFETLVAQQNERAVQPQDVETYLLLGNLYQQSGQADKATELWNQGLNLFPQEARLRESLGLE